MAMNPFINSLAQGQRPGMGNQLGGAGVRGPQPMMQTRPAVRPIGAINRDPSLGYGTGGLEPRPPMQTGGPEPRPPLQTGGPEPRPIGVMPSPTSPPQYAGAPGQMSPGNGSMRPGRFGAVVPNMARDVAGQNENAAGGGWGFDHDFGGYGSSEPFSGNGQPNSVGIAPGPSLGLGGLMGYSGFQGPYGGIAINPSTPATPSTPTGPIGRPGIGPLGYAPAQGYGYNTGYGGYGEGPAPGSDPMGYGGFANNGYGSMGYGVTPGGFAGYDANGNAVAAGTVADAYGGYAGGYGGGYGGGGASDGGYGGGGGYGNGGVGGNDNDHG